MARDFRSFKGKGDCKKNVEDVINTYQGKSENELMSEIIQRYTEGISNGTLSKEELDKFSKNAASYLSPEQMQKLNSILSKLKKM